MEDDVMIRKQKTESLVYFGFGGWLYLVAIQLILGFGNSLFYFLDTILPLYQSGKLPILTQQNPLYGIDVIYETIMHLIYIVFPLVIGYFCYKQKLLFKKLAITFYVYNILANIIYYFISQAIPELASPPISSKVMTGIVGSLISAAIWIPYFILSKRVKNTYVL
jgi:hypothetical protein